MLTEREREVMERMVTIGKRDTTLKGIASELGITYHRIIEIRQNIARKNGYYSVEAMLCDYAVERSSAPASMLSSEEIASVEERSETNDQK